MTWRCRSPAERPRCECCRRQPLQVGSGRATSALGCPPVTALSPRTPPAAPVWPPVSGGRSVTEPPPSRQENINDLHEERPALGAGLFLYR